MVIIMPAVGELLASGAGRLFSSVGLKWGLKEAGEKGASTVAEQTGGKFMSRAAYREAQKGGRGFGGKLARDLGIQGALSGAGHLAGAGVKGAGKTAGHLAGSAARHLSGPMLRAGASMAALIALAKFLFNGQQLQKFGHEFDKTSQNLAKSAHQSNQAGPANNSANPAVPSAVKQNVAQSGQNSIKENAAAIAPAAPTSGPNAGQGVAAGQSADAEMEM